MDKFKKATKRIVAIAASTALVSASAFAFGNYPNNFVDSNNTFNGKVIVSADVGADDMAAAAAVVDDLKSEFSGDQEKVTLTAKKSVGGGDSVTVADSGKTLNYGEALSNVKTSSFDDGDSNLLQDETLDFKSSEDYTQELTLAAGNGVFSHTLRDDLNSDNIDHIFFDKGSVISYKFELDSTMDMSAAADSDIIGKELMIMGNEFTVSGYSLAGADNLDELELIGGANKVSLGEGESTTIIVDGVSYEVSVQSVSTNKVLLTVNGESKSIDQYDTDKIGGVNIAVTDLVESSRDAVKGYCEIVVGGQKVLLKDGSEVEINEEKISDLYEDYKVVASFDLEGDSDLTDNSFEGFSLDYQWDNSDGIMLEAGDSYEDKVFQAFNLVFEGTNDVEYSDVTLESNRKELKLSGTTVGGDDFSEKVAHVLDKTDAATAVSLIGGDTDMPLFVSNFDIADGYKVVDKAAPGVVLADNTAILALATDAEVIVYNEGSTSGYTEADDGNPVFIGSPAEVSALFTVAGSAVTSIKSTGADSGLRFLTGDADNQQVYELTGYSESDDEYDVTEILEDSPKTGIAFDDLSSKLDDLTFTALGGANDYITQILNTEANTKLSMDEELLIDLTDVTNADVDDSTITFTYDEGDMDVDTTGDATGFTVSLGDYDTTDEEFTLNINSGDFVPFTGGEADISDSNDNTEEYVTKYGTKVVYDAEDKLSVEVMTPNKQVEAEVNLVFGAVDQDVKTYTVLASEADAKTAELEADGYTVTSAAVPTSDVTIDITAADIVQATEGMTVENAIVVGGPAVNAAARELLGVDSYDSTADEYVNKAGDAVARYFEASNSVLVYGYTKADTTAIVKELNAGNAVFK